MHWIYLSPHLDDIAYSCGGLAWQQTQAGDTVEIWTICAGDLPEGPLSPLAQEHHTRWGVGREAVAIRREEDIHSNEIIGAAHRHLSVADAIYRLHPQTGLALYTSSDSIFGKLDAAEDELVNDLAQHLRVALPADASVVVPLTVGNHVDHHLTLAVAHKLERPLCYYADFPYVDKYPEQVDEKLPPDVEMQLHPLTPQAIQKWGDAIAAHASQLSTFWPDETSMRAAIQTYYLAYGGLRMWKNS
ncbi:MAG: hypothetical protein DWQ07_04110 [Chloroflexi bacterium]|nr:MAG: hypothetical protein DWQ07_04110 [Chloroflexota bacterium]MBL1193313.1 hypothetical protein [Chloroflexota bacterium]NOH10605.1 hypothetical protein [Chloroflexota bacterium]